MTAPDHITLTGFSGTGKSTVARLVAALLSWEAIDADELIEQRTGRAVPDIIAEDGEAAFRAVEAQTFADLKGRERVVIASGGGVLVNEATRRHIVEAGLVVWLQASPETTSARVADDDKERDRPLRGSIARTRRVMDQRAALY
ncbi:MAG TPA: shikimate kinase, partial [Dehalococcoidia bacterium]|nr:shikimate kinase [Dehalococcoidia bacterium]